MLLHQTQEGHRVQILASCHACERGEASHQAQNVNPQLTLLENRVTLLDREVAKVGNRMRRTARLFENVTGMETIQPCWDCRTARREFYIELEEPRAASLVVSGPCDLDDRRGFEVRVSRDGPIPRISVI